MRAARYYGQGDVRIEDIAPPAVQPGHVKIAPAFVGICGTDLHEYLGGPTFCPVHAHPVTHETLPVTLGHEFSGVVAEVGEGVTGFTVGQPVCAQPTIFCGTCAACEAGAFNACHNGGFVGLSGGGGGLSEAVCIRATHVFPLPAPLTLETGALVEPLSVSWHAVAAVDDALIGPHTVAVIMGGGPIGLAAILCLRARGVTNIVVSELAAQRQAFARQFGAARVVHPLQESLLDVVRGCSGGRGADVVFDCAGVPASLTSACEVVRVKGTVVNVAIWEKAVPFDPNLITFKESVYTSVLGYQREDFQAVIENLRTGKIDPKGMVTRKIKLENLVEDGIKTLINDKDNHVKILVEINQK